MLPESFLADLRYKSDIEETISRYTTLKRAGRNLKGLCPFHNEKTPSFVVYPESQSFYCFGCGAGGDVVNFVRKIENISYMEAIKMLAERAGMPLPQEAANDRTAALRQRLLELNKTAARYFYDVLNSPAGEGAMQYLNERGVSPKMLTRFGIGYAPDSWDGLKNHLLKKGFTIFEMAEAAVVSTKDGKSFYDSFRGRVMFPIIDLRGNVIAFGGRAIKKDGFGPKYLNSADTPVFKKSRNLFALNLAKQKKEENIILCEGYMDVVAVHQAGFTNAVATLGTALTPEQAKLVAMYTSEVVIAYDSDNAGQLATKRAINIFDPLGVSIKVLKFENAKDPDEYIKQFGAKRFKMLIKGSNNAIEYEIARLYEKHDTTTDNGKLEFLKEFVDFMASLNNALERDIYISKHAQSLNVSKEAIEAQVQTVRKRRQRAEKNKTQRLEIFSTQDKAVAGDRNRLANMKYALAEEKIILILYKNPDYYGYCKEKINKNDFVTDINRSLFEIITNRIDTAQSLDIIVLGALLDEQLLARLTYILANDIGLAFAREELDDYINGLLRYKLDVSASRIKDMNEEELKSYIENLAKNKK